MLETMLGHVEAGYTQNGNPYHNNMHACDVLQTTHYFISQTGLAVSIVLLPFFEIGDFLVQNKDRYLPFS